MALLPINRVIRYFPFRLQKMAVAAYFPFDNRVFDDGTTADWAWAMAQWDRVAMAGEAVRLVVAEQSYSRLLQQSGITDMKAKFKACRTAGQLVFGYVHSRYGEIPLGTTGQTYSDSSGTSWPVVRDQVDAWVTMYGSEIDGIYIDEGPIDCASVIPGNYQSYVNYIRSQGYLVFLLVPQYPDNLSTGPWLRNLNADYLALWEEGVTPYETKYYALDYCVTKNGIGVPSWWNGWTEGYRHVHIINDCPDVQTMHKMAKLAYQRDAMNVWITVARKDPNLGSVYDRLPPYWDDEVKYFTPPLWLRYLLDLFSRIKRP